MIAGQSQLLAGASHSIADGVANIMRFAGLDLSTAIGLATSQPCRLLKLPINRLERGGRADLVLFEWEKEWFNVRATLLAGQKLFSAHGT